MGATPLVGSGCDGPSAALKYLSDCLGVNIVDVNGTVGLCERVFAIFSSSSAN